MLCWQPMGVNKFATGTTHLGLQSPNPLALLCHTVNGLTSSDLGSHPPRNKQRKCQTRPAEGSATVWPDLQHVKLQCQHEAFESLRFKKRTAQKASFQHCWLLYTTCTRLVHDIAYSDASHCLHCIIRVHVHVHDRQIGGQKQRQ